MINRFTMAVAAALMFSFGTVCARGIVGSGNEKLRANTLTSRTAALEKQIKELQKEVKAIKQDSSYVANNLDLMVEMYAHGPAVVTSPALGIRRSADDASDLMINLSSMNEDLVLLKLRQKMDNYSLEQGLPLLERPIIALSGGVEGQIDYSHRKNYDGSKKVDINFSKAELDIIGEASPWATAAINIVYEDSNSNYRSRIDNSRFKLDRGFLTIGQLAKFPLYFTMGQVFAPFGSYSSYMITDPSTKVLGRIKDRIALLGYHGHGIWGDVDVQAYGFAGDTKKSAGGHELLSHGGFNVNYGYARDKFKFTLGGSVVGNIMESDGIFSSVVLNNKNISRQVYGLSARAKIDYGMFNLRAEYVGAGKHFDSKDMSFNNHEAKPQALNLEGAMEFKLFNKPNTFALGYGRTWQALALKLPKHNFFAAYNISLLKNTILGFEYRHDINYGAKEVAKTRVDTYKVDRRHQNIFTTQLGVYF